MGDKVKPTEEKEETRQEIIAHFLTSLVWIVIITFVFAFLLEKMFSSQTEQLKSAAYDRLISNAAQTSGRDDISVSVVDISELTPKRINRPGGAISVTPRDDLKRFLTAIITSPETRPRAVGIDVDFSPDSIGLSDPDDPAFFEFCQALTKEYHVPIYLGVSRAVAAGPEGWLGLPQYSTLAANIAVPREDKKQLPARIWPGNQPLGDTATLPSMGVALGTAYAGTPPNHWLFNIFQDDPLGENDGRLHDKISATKFLVNYSMLKDLQNRVRPLKYFAPPFSDREKEYLSNKIVLLGNDNPSGQDIQPFPDGKMGPGVYLHACAAATLASMPLYQFGFWASLGLDFLLTLLLTSGYTLTRLWLHARSKVLKVELKALFVLLAALVVWGAVLLAQGKVVPGIHIVWLDFLLVAVAYLLHTPLEEFASTKLADLKKALVADRTKTTVPVGKAEEEVGT